MLANTTMPISANQMATDEMIEKSVPVSDVIKTFTNLVADVVLRKKALKPASWSARSNAPYFKERFAIAIQLVMDDMMRDGESRMYWYKDSPNISPDSLYNRLYQGRLYLLEFMDPDGKYKMFCETFTISKQKGKGILLCVNKDVREKTTMLRPTVVGREEVQITWRDEVDAFLEDTNEKLYEKKKLSLDDDAVINLKASLETLEGIIYDISNTQITIRKI